jgi:hypothetical protein
MLICTLPMQAKEPRRTKRRMLCSDHCATQTCFLVAFAPVRGLLLCAKHLFVAANSGKLPLPDVAIARLQALAYQWRLFWA